MEEVGPLLPLCLQQSEELQLAHEAGMNCLEFVDEDLQGRDLLSVCIVCYDSRVTRVEEQLPLDPLAEGRIQEGEEDLLLDVDGRGVGPARREVCLESALSSRMDGDAVLDNLSGLSTCLKLPTLTGSSVDSVSSLWAGHVATGHSVSYCAILASITVMAAAIADLVYLSRSALSFSLWASA